MEIAHHLTASASRAGARIDLLFTMSDITRAGGKPDARICVLANECKAQHRAAAVWWSQTGSNRRPPACKAGALPTELWPLASQCLLSGLLACRAAAHDSWHSPPFATLGAAAFASLPRAKLVGLGRFELPTSRLSSARSNQLSYKPEPGVSGQKPVIRGRLVASDYRILITDSWSARSRRKRNGDGGVLPMGQPILKSTGPDVSKRSDRDA